MSKDKTQEAVEKTKSIFESLETSDARVTCAWAAIACLNADELGRLMKEMGAAAQKSRGK